MERSDREYLADIFDVCLNANYITVEGGGSFALEKDGERLLVLFEKSDGYEDWQNNLDFKAVMHSGREVAAPYSQMNEEWYCHAGFLRVWKSILPYIKGALLDLDFREITCVGYSHGAALALLCHEYIWYNRHDLRGRIYGYGFGCPRVIYGNVENERARWQDFYIIRNYDDIVTHLPPRLFGYRHVGKVITIGGAGRYSRVDAHRAENYIAELLY